MHKAEPGIRISRVMFPLPYSSLCVFCSVSSVPLWFVYRANSTARVSRTTVTLISPG
jgi:hypothetical protein